MAVLASDNFNRADNADLGASWDVLTGNNAFSIVANAVSPANVGDDSAESNNSVTWPNDQYSQVVLITSGYSGGANDGVGVGVALRCATGARTFYRIVAAGAISNGTELAKFVAGSYTSLGNSSQAWVTTNILYGEAVGTTIKVKRNGTDIISVTDSAITSGRPGLSHSGPSAAAVLDDWEGGDLGVAFTPVLSHLVGNVAVQRSSIY